MNAYYCLIALFCIIMFVIFPSTMYLTNKKCQKKVTENNNPDSSKKSLFTCPWFSLVKDGHYFYIEYPNKHAGIVIIPIVDETHILMVKNYRFPIKQYSWELPRGFIDNNESFIEAALRELKEETGYLTDKLQCEVIGFVAPDTSILNNSLPIVFVKLKSSDITNDLLDKEISEVQKVSLKDLNRWIVDNQVIDGITLSSLHVMTLKK